MSDRTKDVVVDTTETSNDTKKDDNVQDDNNNDETIIIRSLLKLDKAYAETYNTIDLTTVTILNLSNTGLSTLPDCLPKLVPNLSILFCSNNNFSILPIIIGQCCKLQMIAFKSCGIKSIPDDAFQNQLRWLILTDNKISILPDTIGRCIKLQKCMLSGNQLSKLPDTIINCQNLELIRLASNQFHEPPIQLLTKIPSLKWVALSDNPFLDNVISDARKAELLLSLPIIENISETDGIILGQGAGGITRKVLLPNSNNNPPTYVAVKQYPTEIRITSDGLPEQEKIINCAIAATATAIRKEEEENDNSNNNNNTYSAFIKVLGQTISGGALIMEYLDGYTAIAKPPSFDTCSRDVYDDIHFKLSYEQTISIITDLLNALYLLHTNMGIIHGDFYGHNILIQKHTTDSTNIVRLSDFGAAFFYERNTEYGQALEQIEIRSFLVFVQEISNNLIATTAPTTTTSETNLFTTFITKSQSVTTFEQIQIIWNQLRLQQLSQAFASNETPVPKKEESKV